MANVLIMRKFNISLSCLLIGSVLIYLFWNLGESVGNLNSIENKFTCEDYKTSPEEYRGRIFKSSGKSGLIAIPNLEQADPWLLTYLRCKHLIPPLLPRIPLQLDKMAFTNPQAEILKQLNGKRDGFFIECGALDGELMSNTVDLEINYGWTGLLIEGSPSLFQLLKAKNRKAWISNICLTGKQPETIEFMRPYELAFESETDYIFVKRV